MKIISIVGIRHSGKTSTITALIEAIRRRGKSVGVCKTMLSPTYTLGKSVSDAQRFRRAGSELICIRSKGETAFLHPEALPLSKVFESYRGCDYVLLEGDYFAPIPRIVCAQQEEDAIMRMNTRTLAFAGRISEQSETELPLPCFNALTDAESLLAHIDKMIPDIMPCTLLDQQLPPVSGIVDDGFSNPGDQCSEEETEPLQVIWGDRRISLSAEQQAVLIGWIKESENNA